MADEAGGPPKLSIHEVKGEIVELLPRRRPPAHTKTGTSEPKPDGTGWVRTEEYRAGRAARADTRRYNRKVARRPKWWTPDGVLDRLEAGERLTDILDAAVRDCPTKMRQLGRDIQGWKESDPFYRQRWEMASDILRSNGEFSADAQERFFSAMQECGGKLKHAAALCGIGAGLVLSMLDPRNKKLYNPAFAERYRQAEAPRIAEIREKHLAHAERGDGDAKVQQGILQTHLPHLHNPKQVVEVQASVEVNHKLSPELMAFQQSRARALLATREVAALPEPAQALDVVDVQAERCTTSPAPSDTTSA